VNVTSNSFLLSPHLFTNLSFPVTHFTELAKGDETRSTYTLFIFYPAFHSHFVRRVMQSLMIFLMVLFHHNFFVLSLVPLSDLQNNFHLYFHSVGCTTMEYNTGVQHVSNFPINIYGIRKCVTLCMPHFIT